jgi:Ser/Thr protein kinase RdoA (MazF antagonist)
VTYGSGNPRWPARSDPADPWYWRREPEVYASGLLDRLGSGLRAPAVRALVDRPDGTVALWLEDVPEGGTRSPERLGEVARRLGAAQAALAVDPPRDRWLARGWLGSYLDLRAELLDDELARGREAILARLDTLPQTLCHNDLHPANVLGRDADVLIDWAYCGLGAVGLDAGVLVADTLLDGFVPLEETEHLATVVWDGYEAGLREAGHALVEDARWAFAAGTSLRLSWLPGWCAHPDADPARRERYLAFVPLLQQWAEEARGIASAP